MNSVSDTTTQIDHVKAGVTAWNQWRLTTTEKINLRGADIRDANLSGADLRYADLREANLRYANLRYANLREADLREADLRGANLRGTDLRYADGVSLLTQTDHGYIVYASLRGGVWRILAGCHDLSIDEAITHWGADTYHTPSSGRRVVAAIRWFQAELEASK